jgi:hypothetical protein
LRKIGFIILVIIGVISCSKNTNHLDFESQILNNPEWDCILLKTYTASSTYNGDRISQKLQSEIKNVGSFVFNSNGSGEYHFLQETYEFNWIASRNQSIRDKNGYLNFEFDEFQLIQDSDSPLLELMNDARFFSGSNNDVIATSIQIIKVEADLILLRYSPYDGDMYELYIAIP